MTREEMAEAVERAERTLQGEFSDDADPLMLAAAAELRKTCATCQHFGEPYGDTFDSTPITSELNGLYRYCSEWACGVISDGSGFCHRWKAKS